MGYKCCGEGVPCCSQYGGDTFRAQGSIWGRNSAPLPFAPLFPREESHWLDWPHPSGSHPPAGWPSPPAEWAALPMPASTQGPSWGRSEASLPVPTVRVWPFIRRRGLHWLVPRPGLGSHVRKAKCALTALPCFHLMPPERSASHWSQNSGCREVTCIQGPDG